MRIKKIKNVIVNNLFETFVAISTIFLFIGMFMIYKPAAFIIVGLIAMFLALIILKNQ